MLAISMAPPMPRLDPAPSLSLFTSDRLRSLNPMSPEKRPKLSLNTSDLAPSFTGSNSGRNIVNPEATATPTTLNTFNNTFELTYRPSPATVVPSPGTQYLRRPTGTASTPVAPSSDQPYSLNLPFGVYSILKNSPIPRDVRRPSHCSASASPRISLRRIFFPAPKKVAFRANLEDEIVTQVYVMRHVDLSSSEDESTPSDGDEQDAASCEDEEGEAERQDSSNIRVDECSLRGRRKRKSATTTEDMERGREGSSRNTSARRSKRKRRRWEWTLETGVFAQEAFVGEMKKGIETDHPEVDESRAMPATIVTADTPEESGEAEDHQGHVQKRDQETSS